MRALQLDTLFSIKDITLRLMSQLFSPDASDALVALAQTDPASIPVKSPELLQPGNHGMYSNIHFLKKYVL